MVQISSTPGLGIQEKYTYKSNSQVLRSGSLSLPFGRVPIPIRDGVRLRDRPPPRLAVLPLLLLLTRHPLLFNYTIRFGFTCASCLLKRLALALRVFVTRAGALPGLEYAEKEKAPTPAESVAEKPVAEEKEAPEETAPALATELGRPDVGALLAYEIACARGAVAVHGMSLTGVSAPR